jgi:hypothetical protein
MEQLQQNTVIFLSHYQEVYGIPYFFYTALWRNMTFEHSYLYNVATIASKF